MFNVVKRFLIIFFVAFIDIILLFNFVSYFGFYGQDSSTYIGFTSFIELIKSNFAQAFIDYCNEIFNLSFELANSITFGAITSFENVNIWTFLMDISGIRGTWILVQIIYNALGAIASGITLIVAMLNGSFAIPLPDSTYTYSRIIVNM